jgi:hypothetical protein
MNRFRLVALILVLSGVLVSAVAAQPQAAAAKPGPKTTGTITLKHDSVTNPDAGDLTIETHVNLTFTLGRFAGVLCLEEGCADGYYTRVSGTYSRTDTQAHAFLCDDGFTWGSEIYRYTWAGPPVDIDRALLARLRLNIKATPIFIGFGQRQKLSFFALNDGLRYLEALGEHATRENTCDGSVGEATPVPMWGPGSGETHGKPKGSVAVTHEIDPSLVYVYSWNLKLAKKKKRHH